MKRLPPFALLPLTVVLTACLPADLGLRADRFLADRTQRYAPIDSRVFRLEPDGNVVGQVQVVTARAEDTFADIARRYDLGFDELVQANRTVDPWLPGEGTPIVLPTQFVLPDAPRDGIVINTAAMRLFYYPRPGASEPPTVITHPIGIGRVGWATPTGETKVVAKAKDPAWYVPESILKEHAEAGDPLPAVVPAGPNNPLGTRVLRLGLPSYLIHGTNKPAGVGMRVSHGCVRLYPEDIEALYPRVPVGTPVHIVNQPMLVGERDGILYLEVHRPLEGKSKEQDAALESLLRMVSAVGGDERYVGVDWDKIARLVDRPLGFPVPISSGSPDVESVLASARPVEAALPEQVAGGEKARE